MHVIKPTTLNFLKSFIEVIIVHWKKIFKQKPSKCNIFSKDIKWYLKMFTQKHLLMSEYVWEVVMIYQMDETSLTFNIFVSGQIRTSFTG